MGKDIIFGDQLLTLAPAHPQADRLLATAMAYVKCLDAQEETKMRMDYLKAQLLADLPEEVGEYPIHLDGGGSVTVKLGEKYEWDKKVLSDLLLNDTLPECVTAGYTVSKAKFDRADEHTRQQLSQALTIKLGLPTIKVTK